MSDTERESTIDTVESKLERAQKKDEEAALELLRSAESDLDSLDADGDEKVDSLATRVEQRIREVERRDEYSSERIGAPMDPDGDDAP